MGIINEEREVSNWIKGIWDSPVEYIKDRLTIVMKKIDHYERGLITEAEVKGSLVGRIIDMYVNIKDEEWNNE